ncbi:hypothetical protein Leryth_011817 [Lithospermum erythrorhizon]|nr:hypothetical protein Leryth_011817 [Lithospermum erythrorhizon]
MGSSSSKSSGSGSTSRMKRTKQRLSSIFLCGASSSSYIPLQLQDHPVKSPLTSVENFGTLNLGSPGSITESSSVFWSEAVNTSDNLETGTSSGSCIGITEDDLLDCGLINLEESNNTLLSNNGEPNSHQPSQESVTTLVAVADAQISEVGSVSIKCSDSKQSSSMEQESRNSFPDQNLFSGQGDISHQISASVPVPIARDPTEVNLFTGDENPQMTATSGPGYSMSDRRIREDMLHVDRLSISSNIFSSGTPELSNSEWRNSRRLFWDSFSRRRSRRHSDSPTILFTSGRADDLGSRDRWHRNLDGGLQPYGFGHQSDNLGVEAHRNDRRWLGSEISDRLLTTLTEFDQQTTLCASGLHPRGTCTCESLYTSEEFSALASISRIITLAETLFEVLEELYRQPFSFSPCYCL